MNSYKSAGVDVEAGYQAVKLMNEHVAKTFRPEVVSGLGGFGGLFEIGKKYEQPVLVSGTDGVGTKLKIAFLMDKHDTVGIDAVAMCVNDIICSGAEPLFFLDYIALGKNVPTKVADIVKGVSEGCVQAGCALIGGETAEMPGFYPVDEYDIAGFAVGVVEKKDIIDGSTVKPGDKIVAFPSSGIHSNGYSLVRKLIGMCKESLDKYEVKLDSTIGEELLKPTRIYVNLINSVKENFNIKSIFHITGGGFFENIPRAVPKGMGVKIDKGTWPVPPIFDILQDVGDIMEKDMFGIFNMGIGMGIIVDSDIAGEIVSFCEGIGEKAYIIGEVTEKDGVVIC